ncbi:MAG TPA: hypothetical protein VGO93_12300 [Candidatus Xenobia bacterium]|jgi:hypothetical protein
MKLGGIFGGSNASGVVQDRVSAFQSGLNGTADQPTDGLAGSAQTPPKKDYSWLWRGPALSRADAQRWGGMVRGVKHQASQVATHAATAGVGLPGMQFLPHAQPVPGNDGRAHGQMTVPLGNNAKVRVDESTTPGSVMTYAQVYDGQNQPLNVPAAVTRNAQGHAEVHVMNPGGSSITMIDLDNGQARQGDAKAAQMLQGAPKGWVDMTPAAPAAAPPPPPQAAGDDMSRIINGG